MAGKPQVGVLALQGDFREHIAVLRGLGADAVPVRRPEELARVGGLVIPGGESSVMDKLSRTFGLAQPLKDAIAGGLPVYGTCAGLIMLADRILDGIAGQQSLGGLDVAGAPQRVRFAARLVRDRPRHPRPRRGAGARGVHPRAHRGERGPKATALAAVADGRVVAVEQGNLIGTSFHPEITGETRFHQYFLDKVRAAA